MTILTCLDTSSGAQRVLDQGKLLADRFQANLSLLHVIEPVATYVPIGASMDVIATTPPSVDPDLTEVATQRLEKLAQPLRADGCTVTCEAVLGMAVDEIVERAKTLRADYIVLGSHGHGAIFHLFSGSVVNGVLKHSPVPVLVVPVRD